MTMPNKKLMEMEEDEAVAFLAGVGEFAISSLPQMEGLKMILIAVDTNPQEGMKKKNVVIAQNLDDDGLLRNLLKEYLAYLGELPPNILN